MDKQNFFTIPLLLILILGLKACGTSNDTVIVVPDAPRAVSVEEAAEHDDEEFIQLNIGIIDPVTNFDPLFADNLSTKRVISLIYDGLFDLDRQGEPIPAIAADVEISDNGLEYLITINRELFFHESPIFTAGLGRRIHARDIKWAFERTAREGSPPAAASLLMNIRGFENFYLEQRYVYDSESRVLDGVSGIQVVNPETLFIELNERDDQFLHKLASPLLSIYPPEALRQGRDGLRNRAIGTGQYILDRVDQDGRIVLTRDNREFRSDQNDLPDINRIDFIYYSSESDLFQAFARNELDLIPELGPEIDQQVLTEDRELVPSYENQYGFIRHPANRLTSFHVYDNSVVRSEWLLSRLSLITQEDFRTYGQLNLLNSRFNYNEDARPMDEYYVAFSDNPFARVVLTELHNLVFLPESSLVFFDIRIPTRRTSLYTNVSDSFHNQFNPLEGNYWLLLETEILSLHQRHITGIVPSATPWSLNPAEINVSASER